MKIILQTRDGLEISYDSQQGGVVQWSAIPCLRCGVCCTKWQPQVDAAEIATIAQNLGVSVDEFYIYYTQKYPLKPGIYLLQRKGKACIFLQYEGEQASCAIHPFRPASCRNWISSLSRSECRAGLKIGSRDHQLIQPSELCLSAEELNDFCRSLTDYSSIIGGINCEQEEKGSRTEASS